MSEQEIDSVNTVNTEVENVKSAENVKEVESVKRVRKGRGSERNREETASEFIEKLVHVNRVTKVVKGGRRFAFAALVVVGDGKGRVGVGTGKSKEVPLAIAKATETAKRSMVHIPMKEGRTLHHDIVGRYGASRVVMRTVSAGTGVIAGGAMRSVFEVLGIKDVVAKSTGSSNPYNLVYATIATLEKLASPRIVAARRGKKVGEIIARRSLNENTEVEA